MQRILNQTKRVFCLSVLLLLALLVYGSVTVPDAIVRIEDEAAPRSIYTLTALTMQSEQEAPAVRTYDAQVRLLSVLPVKRTRLTVSERVCVVPGGDLFGLRLYTSGVIVVSLEDVQTAAGPACPGKEAGLLKGDVILTADGTAIHDHNQFSALLADAQENAVRLTARRGDETFETTLRPAFSEAYHRYLAGLWVRDSAAGIGTMTFWLPQSGIYAGLGHAVCDADTGDVLPLFQGDIVSAVVNGCKKGAPGQAGELQGAFQGERIGSLVQNDEDGVYGRLDSFDKEAETVPVALPREVKTGPCELVCTVDAQGPRRFSAVIEKVTQKDESGRNLVLRVTDDRLLEMTGGIVQGMSGTPVLQNGALVGAVTHVFVNDPKRGYAIFAHTMAVNCLQLELMDATDLAS